jgi:hypothetical protein
MSAHRAADGRVYLFCSPACHDAQHDSEAIEHPEKHTPEGCNPTLTAAERQAALPGCCHIVNPRTEESDVGWDAPPSPLQIEIDPTELEPGDVIVRVLEHDLAGCHCDVRLEVRRENDGRNPADPE